MENDTAQSPDSNSENDNSQPTSNVKEFLDLAAKARLRDSRDYYIGIIEEDCSKCSSDALNKIGKWEELNKRPITLFFNIKEAAIIAEVTPDSLLHAGGKGELSLLVSIPPSVFALPFYNGAAGGTEATLEMLSLSDADCRSIAANGFTSQFDFESGYNFSNPIAAYRVLPGYMNRDFMYDHARWRTHSGNSQICIKIDQNYLFVTRLSLFQLLDNNLFVVEYTADLSDGDSSSSDSKTFDEPWLIKNPIDPEPAQPWYTPARYFARELIIADSSLLQKKELLAEKVAVELNKKNIIDGRGRREKFKEGSILKSFTKVNLG